MNGPPRSSSAAREQIKLALDRLFQMLKNDSCPFIPAHAFPNLGINVLLFDPDIPGDCGRYFTPWTTEQMANHEKNPEVNDESTGLQALGSPLDEGVLSCPQETYTWSSQMSERLKWEVESAPRNGTRGDVRPLRDLILWCCAGTLPFSRKYSSQISEQDRKWKPKFYWTVPGPNAHIKICMCSSVEGDPDQILRTELLVIVATMRTRLDKEYLGRHMVIPVMLFSFMGQRQGRILTAYYNGHELMVRMSPLYRFLTQDTDSMFLFTRYLVSDGNPRGDTTRLPHI